MTKTTTILVFSAILAIAIGITASTSMVDAKPPEPGATEVLVTNDETQPIPVTGMASSPACPADKVQHWYTARITQSLSFIELRSNTGPTIHDGDSYWIQIPVDSDDLFIPHDSVIDRLTDLGYEAYNLNTQTSDPLLYSFDWIGIEVWDIASHTTICAES